MYEDSPSQIFKTPSRIKSGADALKELRSGMTFLAKLGDRDSVYSQINFRNKVHRKITDSSRQDFSKKIGKHRWFIRSKKTKPTSH